jgi:hypothetical protein
MARAQRPRRHGSLTLAVGLLSLASACADRAPRSALSELRLTPAELEAPAGGNNQIGSSGLSGVHTKVLLGDPSRPGFYSILLFVPAHTTIRAHSHRDDRVATVIAGTWHFGYGDHFDPALLKELPPGSVYSEPGGPAHNHFAQTADEAVVVHIDGFGPTDTRYFDPADAPTSAKL